MEDYEESFWKKKKKLNIQIVREWTHKGLNFLFIRVKMRIRE